MSATLTETLASWQAGSPCDKHDLAYCASCKEQAGIRRDATGELRFQGDCAVRTFARLLGGAAGDDYGACADFLRPHGYNARVGGTPVNGLVAALEDVGFKVVERTRSVTPEQALFASKNTDSNYFVAAWKGRQGHAWAIVDGVAEDAYSGQYRYRIFQVTES